MEEAETRPAYDRRLNKSFLYPAYSDTIDKLVADPFSQDVELLNIPDELKKVSSDVDRTGKDITAFAAEVFEAGLDYGLTHILVDYPVVPPDATLEDKVKLGIRPTLVHVTPLMLIGWQSEGTGAQARLTKVRIREEREEPDAEFGNITVRYIRVITPNTWELYKDQGGKNGYLLVDQGVNTLGVVPLVTVYFKRRGFMEADPTLEGLAWLNVEHWQSSSEQNNCLGAARFVNFFGKGFTENEVKKGIVVGPRQIISSTNPDADLKIVEHTGQAIAAGERHLRTCEQRMEVLGLHPYVQRQGVETATGKRLHAKKSNCALQKWIRKTEEGILTAFRLAAQWENTELPEEAEVRIYDDFDMPAMDDAEPRFLLDMAMAGMLDNETLIDETRRRNLISRAMKTKEILSRIKAQGPNLAAVGVGAPAKKPKDRSTSGAVGGGY